MGQGSTSRHPVRTEFLARVWREEVERLGPHSNARQQAERARREIEVGGTGLRWLRCSSEARDGTSLPSCWKLYVPLGAIGASAAPFGFVFRLASNEPGPALLFTAFGERHPTNPGTRSVYERAHKQLHGRYP